MGPFSRPEGKVQTNAEKYSLPAQLNTVPENSSFVECVIQKFCWREIRFVRAFFTSFSNEHHARKI